MTARRVLRCVLAACTIVATWTTPTAGAAPLSAVPDYGRPEDDSTRARLLRQKLKSLAASDRIMARVAGPDVPADKRAALGALLSAVADDDQFIAYLLAHPKTQDPIASMALPEDLFALMMRRSSAVARSLDDDDLDELFLMSTPDDARTGCLVGLSEARVTSVSLMQQSPTTRAIELYARGWRRMNDRSPEIQVDLDAYRRAEPMLSERLGVATTTRLTAIIELMQRPGDDAPALEEVVKDFCDVMATVRDRLIDMPKAERVAWVRLNLDRQAREVATPAERSPRVKSFKPGDVSLEFPDEVIAPLRRSVKGFEGSQRVRISVDPDGVPLRVEIVASRFVPERVTDEQGQEIDLRAAFERRVTQFFLAGRFDPRRGPHASIVTVYELPVTWTLPD